LRDQLMSFVDGRPQVDDMTILLVRSDRRA